MAGMTNNKTASIMLLNSGVQNFCRQLWCHSCTHWTKIPTVTF